MECQECRQEAETLYRVAGLRICLGCMRRRGEAAAARMRTIEQELAALDRLPDSNGPIKKEGR